MGFVASKKTRSNVPARDAGSSAGGPPWVLIGGVLAVVVVAAVALFPGAGPESMDTGPEATAEAESAEAADAPPRPEIPTRPASPAHPAAVPLPSLPLVPNMVPRAPEVVRAAYEFAAYNPDILEYVPCFCGCETAGHERNADCFVASRNEDGSVAEWENHGMACLVCVDVARDSMQLHAAGGSVRDIRAAVEAKYGPVSTRQTPTPAPPPAN